MNPEVERWVPPMLVSPRSRAISDDPSFWSSSRFGSGSVSVSFKMFWSWSRSGFDATPIRNAKIWNGCCIDLNFRRVGEVCTLMLHSGDPEENAVLTLRLRLFCVILSTFFNSLLSLWPACSAVWSVCGENRLEGERTQQLGAEAKKQKGESASS